MSTSKHVYNLSIKRIPTEKLKHKVMSKIILPISVDLRSKMPEVYDQGELGSCTANALAACFEYENKKENKNDFVPSRLFIYYNERVIENSVDSDEGASLYDGIKSLQKSGVCPENMWPYNISQFKIKPPKICYKTAAKHKAIVVANIQQDITSMKNSLSNGYPFVVGISIYKSFESPKVTNSGVVSIPDINNEEFLGGHAVLVCGYNDIGQIWIVRNSWGTSWGDKGYFYLPYLYLLDSHLSSDLWNITKLKINSGFKYNIKHNIVSPIKKIFRKKTITIVSAMLTIIYYIYMLSTIIII